MKLLSNQSIYFYGIGITNMVINSSLLFYDPTKQNPVPEFLDAAQTLSSLLIII